MANLRVGCRLPRVARPQDVTVSAHRKYRPGHGSEERTRRISMSKGEDHTGQELSPKPREPAEQLREEPWRTEA